MQLNPNVRDCAPAPIAEVWSWVDPGRTDLLDLCQAVPADPPAQELADYLAQRISRGEAATYTDIAGLAPLREALARDIGERYQASVVADDLMITAGCNQAFCAVIDALCREGDEVILPLPAYFNHDMWLTIRGLRARYVTFQAAGGEPDLAEIAAAVTARTRAIVLVSPNNPTGAIYSPEFMDQALDIAAAHGIHLLVDETYRDFMDATRPPHRLFTRPDWRESFVHLYSFSKAFSLTGYRVGAVAAGPALRESLTRIQDCVVICASHPGQLAAAYGLQKLQAWKSAVARQLIARAAALRDAFMNNELKWRLVSAGAYFAYIEHPFPGEDARVVARRLAEEAGVLCLPGSFFGAGQEPYLRFAFANLDEKHFPELIRRLLANQ